jgi:hypothetical protein
LEVKVAKLRLRRKRMKRNLIVALFVAVLFVTLNAGSIPQALAGGGGGGCSVADAAGQYSFSYSGVAILPSGSVPIGAVGNYSQDASGNLVGSEINNLGGTAAFQTLKGKITVSHDCSAEGIVNVYQGGKLARKSTIHLQYDGNTQHVRIIFEKVVLPPNTNLPVVITGDGTRLFSGHGE